MVNICGKIKVLKLRQNLTTLLAFTAKSDKSTQHAEREIKNESFLARSPTCSTQITPVVLFLWALKRKYLLSFAPHILACKENCMKLYLEISMIALNKANYVKLLVHTT